MNKNIPSILKVIDENNAEVNVYKIEITQKNILKI
jgi:hypothetical protein